LFYNRPVSNSALPLLVLLFAANDEQNAFAPNDFAITADFLY
jgi:hypothetical protein